MKDEEVREVSRIAAVSAFEHFALMGKSAAEGLVSPSDLRDALARLKMLRKVK